MHYLLLFIFLIFLSSCSSNKDLVDIEYYMSQGKEVLLVKNKEFKEITKIKRLKLSEPLIVNDWLSSGLNTNNFLPRFLIDDFKKKTTIEISAKSFLVVKKDIYVIDKNSNLIVLDENLKELKRKLIYQKKIIEDYILDFSMCSDSKQIYTSDNLGNIHAIDIETLKIKWTLKLGVPIKSNLYLYNNNLFFVNTNSKLYSVKTSSGAINWSYETASKLKKEKYQISIFNNLLVTNNDYGEIYLYDLDKKNIIWKLSLTDIDYQIKLKNFKPSYFVYNSGILYFSSNFGETLAIEVSSGNVIWRNLLSTSIHPIINNDYVFLLNKQGFFYILNKYNGEIIYSKDLSEFISEKKKIVYEFYTFILGKHYIYFINSSENLVKLDINNLNLLKIDNYSLNNPKYFFTTNNYLYFVEDNRISKFYN